jgi:hypothetical protein
MSKTLLLLGIAQLNTYRVSSLGKKPVVLYDNHRWVLPAISEYFTTNGRNRQSFIRGLISKAGVLTVAREPSCCGGEEKSDRILASLNKYVFDGNLGRSAGFRKPYARY